MDNRVDRELRTELEARLRELASFPRPSASEGERRAAELIAGWLREDGCEVSVESVPAHGGYWWPLGLPNSVALVAALATRGRRSLAAAVLAAAAAAAIADDVGGGRLWFRRVLPRRRAWNVVAHAGDPAAERTLVLIAHHDAAHSGLVFHPGIASSLARRFPRAHERSTQAFPIMYTVWIGPVLIGLGALLGRRWPRRLGLLFAAGATTAMADIGRSVVVPGANDNLSAVVTVLAVARSLAERPQPGLSVLLLSNGAEESFMEGMRGFMAAHGHELDREHTEFLCLECLGGPYLQLIEGEGMLHMRDYSPELREAVVDAARRAGVAMRRRLRTVAATDGLIPLRAGYRVATLASIDFTKLPANYHWPSDAPDNLDWSTIGDAIAVCEELIRGPGR
ncbi:MAG TPA: M28 family peptidase [Solirubrobacteraceae bacterium]|jgi:hypothetical protein|nr:M28 family peptidase [Solirubrobacteraceae bacterium]